MTMQIHIVQNKQQIQHKWCAETHKHKNKHIIASQYEQYFETIFGQYYIHGHDIVSQN